MTVLVHNFSCKFFLVRQDSPIIPGRRLIAGLFRHILRGFVRSILMLRLLYMSFDQCFIRVQRILSRRIKVSENITTVKETYTVVAGTLIGHADICYHNNHFLKVFIVRLLA